MSSCSNPNCFVHDGEQCCMGELNHQECSSWKSGEQANNAPKPSSKKDIPSRVSWSSSSFGSADLTTIYHQVPSILIGLLGSHNTGKTTFLAANYLQLISGNSYQTGNFCSSFTLGAWESIASWARINNEKQLPSYPPHTPRSVERSPGILHIGLKSNESRVKNIFLTDAPGEWFTRWAIDSNSVEAQGAKWTAEHSDAYLIFADCEKLCGTDKSTARRELRTIIERLGEVVGNKPTILIWAKSEHQPPDGIKRAIQRALTDNVPHAIEFKVTVEKPNTFRDALNTLLTAAWSPPKCRKIADPVIKNTPYYAFRGHNENT